METWNVNNQNNNQYNVQDGPSGYDGYINRRDPNFMRKRDWILVLILNAIPIVGLIMMLIWSFSSSDNMTRKNFARANLIMALAYVVIVIIAYFGMFTLLYSAYNL